MSKEARTKAYITAVILASVSLAALTAWVWPIWESTSPLWLVFSLMALVALAGRFPIKLSKQADASLRVVPIFTAVLLLHPLEAAVVAAIGTLISEMLIKAPLRASAFNAGVDSLAAGAAGIVFFSLRPEGTLISLTSSQILPALAAGFTVLAVNLALVDIMALVRQGWEFLNHWKFNYYLVETPQEAGFLAIGLIGALLFSLAWWGPIILIVPALLTYFGFRYVVSEAAEKTRMAEELEANLNELREMQAQLINSAKMASVGSLATGIAHEINNPVFAISGRADLLLKGAEKHLASDKALEYVENMKEMSSRIADITSHLMEYAQPEEDKKEVVLSEVIEAAITLMGKKAKSMRIIRDYQGVPIVEGIPAQLQQVFLNLLTNSAEAVPDWGNITVGCSVQDSNVVAYVKDDGIGIDSETREHLFEPFVGSKDVNSRIGLGLGLYTCHKIIAGHKGEISIESKEGKGTTVYIKLPAADSTSSVSNDDFDWDDDLDETQMPKAVGLND